MLISGYCDSSQVDISEADVKDAADFAMQSICINIALCHATAPGPVHRQQASLWRLARHKFSASSAGSRTATAEMA